MYSLDKICGSHLPAIRKKKKNQKSKIKIYLKHFKVYKTLFKLKYL